MRVVRQHLRRNVPGDLSDNAVIGLRLGKLRNGVVPQVVKPNPDVLAGNTAIGYIQRDSTGEWQMGIGAMRLASSLVVGCRQAVDDGQMIEGMEDICIFLYVVTPPRTPA